MHAPHTVTLVLTRDDGLVRERRTIYLEGTLLDRHYGGTIVNGGLVSADTATLYIPETVHATDALTGADVRYVTPGEWLEADDISGLWTLPVGGQQSAMDAYISAERLHPLDDTSYQTLRKVGREVYRITTVDHRNYGSRRMHHWQVGMT